MTPEESVNEYYCWVLSRIKEDLLTTPKNEPIRYRLSHVMAAGVPSKETEKNILKKLAENGALRIEDNSAEKWLSGGASDVFNLKIFQPRFNEIYNHYLKIDSNENFSNEVDEWLKSKDEWTLGKMWRLVSTLNSEWQLRDEDAFNMPHLDRFKRNRISNYNDREAILTNLHKNKFIQVEKMLGQTPQTGDPNKPTGAIFTTIIEQPNIIDDANTKVILNPQKFKVLVDRLSILVNPEKEQDQQTTSWSDDFKWISDTEFGFGSNDSVKFGKADSDRINLFKTLVNAKGVWVEVKSMANQVKKSAGQVRITIGQINKDSLKDKTVEIVGRNDKSQPGAYRIHIKN